MNDSICPVCGKTNSDLVDICQYCGGMLLKSATEPLPAIRPGDKPVKKKTSDLERTLPGWLRDVRRASKKDDSSQDQDETVQNVQHSNSSTSKPSSQKIGSAAGLDLLRGLSQLDDEGEEPAEWLKNLQDILPKSASTESESIQNPESGLSPDNNTSQQQPFLDDSDPGVSSESATLQPKQLLESMENAHTRGDAFDSQKPASTGEKTASEQDVDPSIYADLPDWLASLAGVGTGQTPPLLSNQSNGAPDWLSSLGGDVFTEEPPDLPKEDASDWPARIDDDTSQEITPIQSEITSGDLPAWMADLEEPTPVADETWKSSNVSTPSDMPGWIAGLKEITPDIPAALPSAPVDSLPDVHGSDSIGEIPDWLASLQQAAPAVPTAPTNVTATPVPPGTASTGDLPDWLASLQQAVPAEPTALTSIPVTPVPPITASTGDLPDWLASLQQAAPAEPNAPTSVPVTPVPPTTASTGDLPDWLASLQQTAPVEPAAPTSVPVTPVPPSTASTGDLPDWLASLQQTAPVEPFAPTSVPVTPEPPSTASTGDLPDWLASLQQTASASALVTPETSTGDLSDRSKDSYIPRQENQPEPFVFDARPDNVTQFPFSVTPDQAVNPEETTQVMPKSLQDIAGTPSVDKNKAPFIESASDGLKPLAQEPNFPELQANSLDQIDADQSTHVNDLSSHMDSGIAAPGEQNIDSILSMDTPDWLTGFAPSDTEPGNAPAADSQPSDTDLRPAELPSWVQAMRPVESVMSAENNESGEEFGVENRGPLAGLRSVLPIQPGFETAAKSTVYSPQLVISETQLAQSTLLENLLNSETFPQVISKHSEKKLNHHLRWIIAAILLLAILFSSVIGLKIFPAPSLPVEPGPISLFIQTVKDMPDGGPVLVVVDYQPGFSGEMEAAVGPVIEQLMKKQARLAFISTTPLGGLMAERLVGKFASTYPYQAGLQYIDLGYLPGGAGGIKVFADQPRSALGNDTLSGNLWDSPVLKDVTVNQETRLSHFLAVIVATDNPDTGRLWIEQAQPQLESKPLLMVVSSQAEPMIRPYLLTGQVKGLIAGLEGGVLYETAQDNPGQASASWDAFGIGMLVTELIIIIGGVWGLVSGLRARRAAVERDEA